MTERMKSARDIPGYDEMIAKLSGVITLNEEQRAAVETDAKTVRVIAGAGSGKTRVVIERIARIVTERKATQSEIVAMTFTRKAAMEMRGRLKERLGREAWGIRVSTIHGFFLELCRNYDREIGLNNPFSIIGETDRHEQTAVLHRKLRVKAGIGKARGWLESYYNTGETPDDSEAGGLIGAYQAWLQSINAVDYGMILIHAKSLMAKYGVKERIRSGIKYLFVDEFQDTNRIQYKLIDAIRDPARCNLFVVGDRMQAIYEWRGGDPVLIDDMATEFGPCETVELPVNYRSAPPVIALANRVAADGSGLRLRANRRGGGRVAFIAGADETDAARRTADQVAVIIDIGRETEDVAILYRAHHVGDAFEAALGERKIPVNRIQSEKSFWEHPTIREAMARIRVAVNPWDNHAAHIAAKRDRPDIDALAALAVVNGRSLAAELALAGWTALPGDVREGSLAPLAVATAIEAMGMDRLTDDGKRLADPEADILFTALLEVASPHDRDMSVREFLSAVALRSVQDQLLDTADKPGVQLMTVHAAKGLEWPVVFVAGMEEGVFPGGRKDVNLAEELRLFYVSLTRARDELWFVNCGQRTASWARSPREMKPSRYLNYINGGN